MWALWYFKDCLCFCCECLTTECTFWMWIWADISLFYWCQLWRTVLFLIRINNHCYSLALDTGMNLTSNTVTIYAVIFYCVRFVNKIIYIFRLPSAGRVRIHLVCFSYMQWASLPVNNTRACYFVISSFCGTYCNVRCRSLEKVFSYFSPIISKLLLVFCTYS